MATQRKRCLPFEMRPYVWLPRKVDGPSFELGAKQNVNFRDGEHWWGPGEVLVGH
jgi:hypothetical protein